MAASPPETGTSFLKAGTLQACSFQLAEGSYRDRELLIIVRVFSVVFGLFCKTEVQVEAYAKF